MNIEDINFQLEHWRIWHTFQDCQFIVSGESEEAIGEKSISLQGYICTSKEMSDALLNKGVTIPKIVFKILEELKIIKYGANGTYGPCYFITKPKFTYWEALGPLLS